MANNDKHQFGDRQRPLIKVHSKKNLTNIKDICSEALGSVCFALLIQTSREMTLCKTARSCSVNG